MTPEEQYNHATRFRRFQQAREKFFAPLINNALHKQYLTAADHAHTDGQYCVNKITSARIALVIKHIYIDAGIIYGAKIRADFAKLGAYKKQVQLKRAAIGFSEHMHQLIADYFKTDILNVSEGITQTTRDLITKVFTEAYAAGYSIDQIVAKLKDTELSKIRARLIARTETVTAANQGALFVANETGLLYNKTWLATNDGRTRDDHREVNGNQVGRNDYFIVGGFEMLAPGDRGGKDGRLPVPAKEICNCRCTTTFQPVRDSNGRLVMA